MDQELADFRENSPATERGSLRRFTEEQRQAGLALASRMSARGMKPSVISRQLGISEQTLRQWKKRKKRSLVPLRVVAEERVEEPVRVFLGRMAAELSVAQFAELARRLW